MLPKHIDRRDFLAASAAALIRQWLRWQYETGKEKGPLEVLRQAPRPNHS